MFDTFKPSNFSRCHVSLPECDPDFGGVYIEDMAAPSRSTLHKTLKKQGQVVTSSHELSPWHTCCDCQGPQEPLSSQAGRLKQIVKCHLHCNYPGIKAAFIIRILFFRMPFDMSPKINPKYSSSRPPSTPPKKNGYQSMLRRILRIFRCRKTPHWILPDFHHPTFSVFRPLPFGNPSRWAVQPRVPGSPNGPNQRRFESSVFEPTSPKCQARKGREHQWGYLF